VYISGGRIFNGEKRNFSGKFASMRYAKGEEEEQ
jgi:hypothetical protein